MSPTTGFPSNAASIRSTRPASRTRAIEVRDRMYAIELVDNSNPPIAYISCCCQLEAARRAFWLLCGREGFPSRIAQIISYPIDPGSIQAKYLERIVPDVVFAELERNCSCRG